MKDMKYTILIVTGLGTRQRRIGRTIGCNILKVLKGDSKDWDNPLLADWLESLNAAIESAEEK
jgi:predicted alpha/beta hydrolase family esterase